MSSAPDGNVLDELLKLLKLEQIEENIFRGQSQDLGFGTIFGGQVLGQALSAVSQTVPESRPVHSLHSYFLRHGDPAKPIVYDVDCIRDGSSFTTRRVRAIQKGRAIFNMSASFQIRESGFEHQENAPEVPGPDGIESQLEMMRRMAHKIPEDVRDSYLSEKPIEMRPVDPMNFFAPEKREPIRYAWFRAISNLPDDPALHQYMLAYASDFQLFSISLYPHGQTFWNENLQTASLDHAMWFHRDFRMDDWLLYFMHSPNASGARGMNLGRIYTRDGKLIASVVQESLMRYYTPKK
ncbi:acyl-CoA thioesterase II [Thermodesulfobacteriota bacterium]